MLATTRDSYTPAKPQPPEATLQGMEEVIRG